MQTTATSEKSKSASAVAMHKNKQQSFFAPVKIQPKLTIGAVDDPYEREAEAMADKVMRMPASPIHTGKTLSPTFFSPAPVIQPPVQRQCESCKEEEKLQRKQKQPKEEPELTSTKEKKL